MKPGSGGQHRCKALLGSGEDSGVLFNLIGPANQQYKKPGTPPILFNPRFEVSPHRVFKHEMQAFGCSYLMCNAGDQRADRDGKHRHS